MVSACVGKRMGLPRNWNNIWKPRSPACAQGTARRLVLCSTSGPSGDCGKSGLMVWEGTLDYGNEDTESYL